ncbi:MAG: B12-binding domain-containing radical SAM protein [Bacteroidales bacterium]
MKKKYKCILFSPHFKYVEGSIYREVSNLDPPLGLISLSAFLIDKGFETMVFDLNTEIKSNIEIPAFLNKMEKNYDLSDVVFGISFLTPYAYSSYEIAKQLKIKFPDKKIIAGGAHATFMADEVLKSNLVDIVVRGEGEYSLLEIVQGKALSEINGISYTEKENNGRIVNNPERERIKNINSLPLPSYHLLKIHKYKPILGSYRKLPSANIITSRGCPGKCTFCCKTFGRRVSFKSPDTIIKEIKLLIRDYNVKHINIYDDTFTLNKKRVLAFCDLLIKENLKIEWTCFARIDTMDEQVLRKMKQAGCYQIMYGVENFNQEILDSLSKGLQVEKIEEVLRLTRKVGIISRASVMVGHTKDTWETYRNNIKALKRLKPDILVSSIFTPIPGSELYTWAKENNRLLSTDWSKFAGNNSVMKLDYLTQKDVIKQYRKIYLDYYYNFPYFFRRIKRINNFIELKNSVLAFFYVLKFIFRRQSVSDPNIQNKLNQS